MLRLSASVEDKQEALRCASSPPVACEEITHGSLVVWQPLVEGKCVWPGGCKGENSLAAFAGPQSSESPLCRPAPRKSLKLTRQSESVRLVSALQDITPMIRIFMKTTKHKCRKHLHSVEACRAASAGVIKRAFSDAYHKAFCYNRTAVSCFAQLFIYQ